MDFSGFPDGQLSVTPLPDLFFGELLPQIDDLGELKLTLHLFWRLAHHKAPLCISRSELHADPVLRRALSSDAIDDALRRAVKRRTLLEVRVPDAAGIMEACYFANSGEGRRDAARVRRGQPRRQPSLPAETLAAPRPNVFALYERHIGMLTQSTADQLQDAEQTFPAEWLTEAFELAAQADKRSWRYVQAILQRWASEGKGPPKSPKPRLGSMPRLRPKKITR